jgi:hypothetical protein
MMLCKLCKGSGRYRGYTGKEILCPCDVSADAINAEAWKGIDLSKMSEPERIAHLVRRNAEAYAKERNYPRSLRHLCGLSSAALTLALRKAGFDAEAAEGFAFGCQHAWVVLGDKIIDITHTQFDHEAPKVVMLKSSDKRYTKHRQDKDPKQAIQDTLIRYRPKEIGKLTNFDSSGVRAA